MAEYFEILYMAAAELAKLSGAIFLSNIELTKISFPYGLSDFVNFWHLAFITPSSLIQYPYNYIMEPDPITETKKRTLGSMLAAELSWKLKSKQDFVVYLGQHRK